MKLAIGTVQFGLDYGISNKSGAVNLDMINRIFSLCKHNNIDMLDTAQAYGNSEFKIGQSNSEGFKIVTKLKPGIKGDEILSSIKESIENLKQRSLYGLLFHNFSDYIENPELYNTLKNVKIDGLVQKIGFSLYYPSELELLFENEVEFDLLQIPYNIFDQRFLPYFKEIKRRNIEIYVRSAFIQGLVFMNPNELSSHFLNYKNLFSKFQSKVNESKFNIAEVCLNFINLNPEIDYLVLGITSDDELKSNTASLKSLSIDEVEFVRSFKEFEITDENIILPFNWK